jgi:hypothetical protein
MNNNFEMIKKTHEAIARMGRQFRLDHKFSLYLGGALEADKRGERKLAEADRNAAANTIYQAIVDTPDLIDPGVRFS